MLAEGDYAATILRGYLGFDNFGNEAAILELGIRDAANEPHTVSWAGGFNGEWAERTVRSLRICGHTGDNLETIGALKGQKISVTIKHKASKKGTVYLQVFINPRRFMEPAEAKAFAARMSRVVAAVDAAEAEPGTDAGQPLSRAAKIADSDIPF